MRPEVRAIDVGASITDLPVSSQAVLLDETVDRLAAHAEFGRNLVNRCRIHLRASIQANLGQSVPIQDRARRSR